MIPVRSKTYKTKAPAEANAFEDQVFPHYFGNLTAEGKLEPMDLS